MAERHSRLFRDVRFSSKGRAKRAKPILHRSLHYLDGPLRSFYLVDGEMYPATACANKQCNRFHSLPHPARGGDLGEE